MRLLWDALWDRFLWVWLQYWQPFRKSASFIMRRQRETLIRRVDEEQSRAIHHEIINTNALPHYETGVNPLVFSSCYSKSRRICVFFRVVRSELTQQRSYLIIFWSKTSKIKQNALPGVLGWTELLTKCYSKHVKVNQRALPGYICFIIQRSTITFAPYWNFVILWKLILGSMTFWTLRPDDYINFISGHLTITFTS